MANKGGRPRKEIDWGQIERGVKMGLMPHELCFLQKRSLPVNIVISFYQKYWPNNEKLKNKVFKRIFRGDGLISPQAKAKAKLRQTIKQHIAAMIIREMPPIEEMLGYSIDELFDHLSKELKQGMTWEKRSEWHIDHIKPASKFTTKQIKECFDLKNLRPIWAEENLKKGRKWQE